MSKGFASIIILLSTGALLLAGVAFAECNPNSKNVVIYVGFHGSLTEVKGAQSACQRGMRVITVPAEDYMHPFSVLEEPVYQGMARIETLFEQMDKEHCAGDLGPHGPNSRCLALSTRLKTAQDQQRTNSSASWKWLADHPRTMTSEIELRQDLDQLKASGASVDSLIISGHDGGGHFWGDLGKLNKETIFDIATAYPNQFEKTNSVILMGCWTSVPFQVEQWKTHMPGLKLIAGFGGSAPSAAQTAGGDYIKGILANESNLHGISEQAVWKTLKSIVNINEITAAVYVDPSKKGCESNINSPAYYAMFAQNENDKNGNYKPGMNKFTVDEGDTLRIACDSFNHENAQVWTPLGAYFDGSKEPSNTPDLVAIYSQLRQNEKCFNKGLMRGRTTPDQVLMLRFFQDVKKNFGHYFAQQISDAYNELDAYGANTPNEQSLISHHKRLMGDSLIGLNRADTLSEISNLSNIRDRAMAFHNTPLPKVNALVNLADDYLYSLTCLDGTWHEYDEHQTLTPPSCGSAMPH